MGEMNETVEVWCKLAKYPYAMTKKSLDNALD